MPFELPTIPKRMSQSERIVRTARSIRGFLTTPREVSRRRKNGVLQLLLGDERYEVVSRHQAEIDAAWVDLESLVAVAVPYWLAGDESTDQDVVAELDRLGSVYPAELAVSYISLVEQSLGEIEEVLLELGRHGMGKINQWLYQNNFWRDADELLGDVAIIAPMTTDYLVAHLYLHAFEQETGYAPELYGVAWMPGLVDAAISTSTQQAIEASDADSFLVLVDKDVTGTTSSGVHEALSYRFPDKRIYSGRNSFAPMQGLIAKAKTERLGK